jgi:uncharacterized protein YbjT (DUF2867 family)
MTKQNTILVTGATGAQGGSVARHLLKNGKFAVRCLTRNPASENAVALQKAGAEIIKGDFEDIESLKTAMKGCYGVYGVTDYWEHFDREYDLGKNLIDAVKSSDIEHFIFSTLPDTRVASDGKYNIPHFGIKAKLEGYAYRHQLKATYVQIAFYFENFYNYFPPKEQEDGSFLFGFPQGDTPLAGIAIEDLGGVVSAILDKPEEFISYKFGVVGDDMPLSEYAEIMTRVLGKKYIYKHVPRDVFAAYEFLGAREIADMFEFNSLYIPNRKADMKKCKSLYPEMQTFETWLKANKDKF